mgnify:CR=1 FL=1
MLPTSPRTMCSPLLCAPHNKGEGVVRRECIGFPGLPGERVCMRLGTACGIRGLSVARRFAVIAIIGAVPAIPSGNFAITMRMARHLLFCERRLPHSAGHTQTWPPNLCLPPPQEVRMMYASA